MVSNQLVACDTCKAEINLRSQIGYFDIPFNIHCPNPDCSTPISGNLTVDQENLGLLTTMYYHVLKLTILEIVESYTVIPIAHIKLLNGFTVRSDAEANITKTK